MTDTQRKRKSQWKCDGCELSDPRWVDTGWAEFLVFLLGATIGSIDVLIEVLIAYLIIFSLQRKKKIAISDKASIFLVYLITVFITYTVRHNLLDQAYGGYNVFRIMEFTFVFFIPLVYSIAIFHIVKWFQDKKSK